MHYQLEIIMPPTDNVEGQVTNILAEYDENAESTEDFDANPRAFWDFWVIGGRWSGNKLKAELDSAKLDLFIEELKKREVTCSGIQAGKQSLDPASQIPMVDALWAEYFPESGISVCPLFAHSNNQYDSSSNLPGDICRVAEIPEKAECGHVLIARESCLQDGTFSAIHMRQTSVWNGCNFEKTDFDGTIKSAIRDFNEKTTNESRHVKDDWLCVTVDYHS
ncbi:hypothetical protein MYE70_10395 [Marinobacter alexandrii]|uniref:hypothetical protein n=1 Tax=Marinobacter alexandrii TaxID=2570351 RepID=UPI001FFE6E85|nr:hypothetical protein [Marinobacter alexandrii]MCK2149475.1 hypothetical protein [Marinobacter alexandrii]